MSFKSVSIISFVLLSLSCGAQKPSSTALKYKFRVMMKDMAKNQVYLNDVVNAAAEEANPNPDEAIGDDVVVEEGEEEGKPVNPDPEAIGEEVDNPAGEPVEEEEAGEEETGEEEENGGDTGEERVDEMVAQLFAELDANSNDLLSLQEFLRITDVRDAERAADLSADQRAGLDKKLTAQFERFAGQDNNLSEAELATLLRGQQGRVDDFRRRNCRGRGPARLESAEELLRRFDRNGDGAIDLNELQAMRDALLQNAGRGRRGPNR